MTAQTVSQAVATRDSSPTGLITQYADSFARVLPTHIKPETWVRLAQGALKKGKRIEDKRDPNFGQFELEVAARNNTGAFLASLLDAARQGLEPGTEQYYLTPRRVKGQLEILGITGYQGYIELMYRAGAVSSVVVQVVRRNDEYVFVRGQLDWDNPRRWDGPQVVPFHRYPPFARDAARGELVGVYAYARMKDGAVSQVVELNQDDIDRIKAANPASGGAYSPWTNWEAPMWMKSAARQLRKWVPTSAEFLREQARAAAEASRVAEERQLPAAPLEFDVLDGEVIEQGSVPPATDTTPDQDWPETTQPGGGE